MSEQMSLFDQHKTCHDVSKTFGRWQCSECGRAISVALTDEPPRFCCGCGRRIEVSER